MKILYKLKSRFREGFSGAGASQNEGTSWAPPRVFLWVVLLLSTAGAMAQDPFITTWATTADGESITIPTIDGGYSYSVSWGDGSTDETVYTGNATHSYAAAGTYTVSISGAFPRIYFQEGVDKLKIKTVEQWGDIAWSSMNGAFSGCANLHIPATDAPDLSNVVSMFRMMSGCKVFNEPVNHWDVSHVAIMGNAFDNAVAFNQEMNDWNMSNVTTIDYMFGGATSFNKYIGDWNTSKVTTMLGVFTYASSFDQDISKWDVSKVRYMNQMFNYATSFKQDLSSWDVSHVTNMDYMFFNAHSFNHSLGSWDISSLFSAPAMLLNAGLDIANYEATLMGWATLSENESQIPGGINLDANGRKYCDATYRNLLTTPIASGGYGWVINGDSRSCVPVIGTIDNQTIDEDVPFNLIISGSDDDGDAITFKLDATSLGKGMIINATTGAFSWTPTQNRIGEHQVTVLLTDNKTEVSKSFGITVVAVNDAPVFATIKDQSLLVGQDLNFTIAATDEEGNPFTFSIDDISLGKGMTINATTGGFSWSPTEAQIGSHTVSVAVSDGDKSSTDDFTITVIRAIPDAPINNESDCGQVLHLDGNLTIATGIDVTNKSFTLEAWARLDALSGDHFIFGGGNASTNNGLHAGYISNSSKIRFSFFGGANDLDAVVTNPDKEWHHLAFTFDKENGKKLKIYIDGIQAAEKTAGSAYLHDQDLLIGRNYSGGASNFNGYLDDVKIWSRVMTNEELANSASGISPEDEAAVLVAHYSFNAEFGQSVITDLTGNHTVSIGTNKAFTSWADTDGSEVAYTYWYQDLDDDGFVGDALITCVAPDETYIAEADLDGLGKMKGDCDDQNAALNPNQVEIPGDGLDNDCNPATFDMEPFITTWRTYGDGNWIGIPINYDYLDGSVYAVDWGDGSVSVFDEDFDYDQSYPEHFYEEPGTYTIKIGGDFPGMFYGWESVPDNRMLRSIEQWGDIKWKSMDYMFSDAYEMVYNATDIPDMSEVTGMVDMFDNCGAFSADLGEWDITGVIYMENIFYQSGMTVADYEATLNGWAAQDVQTEVDFGAEGLRYCDNTARTFLIDQKQWEFSGDTYLGTDLIFDEKFLKPVFSTTAVESLTPPTALGCDGLFTGTTETVFPITSSQEVIWTYDDGDPETTDFFQIQYVAINQPFVTTWRTNPYNGNKIIIQPSEDYLSETKIVIDWGDGNATYYDGSNPYNEENFDYHEYEIPGNYTVSIYGQLPGIETYYAYSYWNELGENLISLDQWGDIQWKDLDGMFSETYNMKYKAADTPDLTLVSSLNYTFSSSAVNADLGNWDISNITSMEGIFNYSSMTRRSYEATLAGWATQEVQSDVTMGALYLPYCDASFRDILVNDFGWSISGDDQQCALKLVEIEDQAVMIGETITFTADYEFTQSGQTYFYLNEYAYYDGMYINETTGEFSFTPQYNQVGIYTVNIYIYYEDSESNFYDFAVFRIQVFEGSNTWNGTEWSHGVSPKAYNEAIIDGNYQSAEHGGLEVKALTINEGKTLTVSEEDNLIVHEELTNEGTVIVKSGGQLITYGSVSGTDYQIERITSFDNIIGRYSIVGSPVVASGFEALGTKALVYGYDESQTYYPDGNQGLERFKTPVQLGHETMQPGTGYFSAFTGDDYGKIVFTGTPNAGDVTVALNYTNQGMDEEVDYQGFNLVSNPYPAAISANDFLDANSEVIDQTIYVWDDNGSNHGRGSNADYLLVNRTLGATNAPAAGGAEKWDGFLRSGQGFFVKTNESGTLTFSDALKNAENNNDDLGFFRMTRVQRIKLALSHENSSRAAIVGFLEEATIERDAAFDAVLLSEGGLQLYTFDPIQAKRMGIQGLPQDYDVAVKVGFSAEASGQYTLSLANLSEITRLVILVDKFTGQEVDLSAGAYTFSSAAGVFNDRFELAAPKTITGFDTQNPMSLYAADGLITVFSTEVIKAGSTYQVIDLSGRTVAEGTVPANSQQLEIALGQSQRAVYILKLTTAEGIWSGKVIMK